MGKNFDASCTVAAIKRMSGSLSFFVYKCPKQMRWNVHLATTAAMLSFYTRCIVRDLFGSTLKQTKVVGDGDFDGYVVGTLGTNVSDNSYIMVEAVTR